MCIRKVRIRPDADHRGVLPLWQRQYCDHRARVSAQGDMNAYPYEVLSLYQKIGERPVRIHEFGLEMTLPQKTFNQR